MGKVWGWWLVWTALGVNAASGGRVLALLPLPLFSHTNSYMPVLEGLAERGHNVTLVAPFPPRPGSSVHHVPVEAELPPGMTPGKAMAMRNANSLMQSIGLFFFGAEMVRSAARQEPLKALARATDETFDLVIAETFFVQECLAGFAHKFKAPLVSFNPSEPTALVSLLTGNPGDPAYVPGLTLGSSDRMGFGERLHNSLLYLLNIAVGYWYYLPKQEAAMREMLGDDTPPLVDLLRGNALTLLDTHLSLGYPRPYLPNTVEIGGLSVSPHRPLPEELKSLMEGAKKGVIYFSIGSYLESSELGEAVLSTLRKVFASLELTVLWKIKGRVEGLSANVHTAEWFPQNAVLAHKNCRVFITHGGIHSLFEAAYHGVPVLGLPVFADQPRNVRFAEEAGFGISLDLDTLTEEDLSAALLKLLREPRFKAAAEKRSRLVRARPLPPLETALFWIEYVMAEGASHLRPASLDLHLFQLLLLDVALVLSLPFALLFFFCCRCRSRRCGPGPEKNKKKTQ